MPLLCTSTIGRDDSGSRRFISAPCAPAAGNGMCWRSPARSGWGPGREGMDRPVGRHIVAGRPDLAQLRRRGSNCRLSGRHDIPAFSGGTSMSHDPGLSRRTMIGAGSAAIGALALSASRRRLKNRLLRPRTASRARAAAISAPLAASRCAGVRQDDSGWAARQANQIAARTRRRSR